MKRAGNGFTPLGGFIRGAIILELAAFFPVLGWLFLWPLALITALGATIFALLNWMPRENPQILATTTSSLPVNSPGEAPSL